ncbi:MAG: OmpW family protein [Burkholderiales bacterium]|nr:OmpW family protein [Burkholderiales bacterium]
MQKKKLLAAAALASLLCVPGFAQQAQTPWQLRVRAVHLQSANGDSTGLGLTINDKWIPELDVSYFFTPNIAAELVLTVPQEHTVRSNGTDIGSVKHLPPTLLAQYHFTNFQGFRPYLGAGINFTRFSSVNLPAGVDVDRNSFGGALQAGVDIPLTGQWSLNLDVKKVWIQTDVSAAGARIGTFKVDPVLLGVGVGYRF